MSYRYVAPENRRIKFFGLDKDGDPALFFLFWTFIWYKDHCMMKWGNHIEQRQTSTMYRQLVSE